MPKCLLCRRIQRRGLRIGGCFLCLDCEKRLLHAHVLPRPERLRLLRLYASPRRARASAAPEA